MKSKSNFKYRKIKRARKEQERRKKNLRRQTKCSFCKARIEQKPRHIANSKNRISKQKRITIILGAGAVLGWGAPLSGKLYEIVKSDSKYLTTTDRIPIGKYVCEKLESYYDNSSEVNFETFLTVLESLYDYAYDSTNQNKIPVFHSFNPSLFTFINAEQDKKINYSELKVTNETIDERAYFFDLWKHYLKLVIDKIAEYTEDIQNEKYSELNDSLRKFIRYNKDRGYIVRIYTTNYDNFIPDVFEGYQEVFNGFTIRKKIDSLSFPYNSDRIYLDINSLNYYNLHGSVYWKRGFQGLSYSFEYTPNYPLNYLEPLSATSDNPGHQHIPSNIIAGYSKLQRASVEPFNLFMNAFYSDCKESDEIITIGYSFSDFHINSAIAQKLSNKTRKYTNISFEKGEPAGQNKASIYKAKREYKTFEFLCGNSEFKLIPNSTSWLKSGISKIYLDGFDNYLNNAEWSKVI